MLNWNFQRGGGGMDIFWNYTINNVVDNDDNDNYDDDDDEAEHVDDDDGIQYS